MPVIPALGRMRQKDQECKTGLHMYIVSSSLAGMKPCLKKREKKKVFLFDFSVVSF
jgi:hypothetical protein